MEQTEKGRYVLVQYSESLLKQIDDYRYENRVPSRAEAIRNLVAAGLERKPPAREEERPAPRRKVSPRARRRA